MIGGCAVSMHGWVGGCMYNAVWVVDQLMQMNTFGNKPPLLITDMSVYESLAIMVNTINLVPLSAFHSCTSGCQRTTTL